MLTKHLVNYVLWDKYLMNVCLVKAMVFPIVMYGCEIWTIKKTERKRIHAFELWCWRRLLSIPWTARRSNQSILKEIIPEYSLEGLMLKPKFQYFGHLMWRANLLEKILILGKTEGRSRRGQGDRRGDRRQETRGRDGWMASPIQWTWVWANSGRWWRTGKPGCAAVQKSWTRLSNWTTTEVLEIWILHWILTIHVI